MEGKCLNCDCKFEYHACQSNGKYCSNKCQGEHQIKKRFVLGSLWNKRMGTYLKEIRGNKCEECDITEWNDKPLTFQVDHTNGNRRDNRYKNLKILCPNCHSQSPTWGVKNASDEGKIKMIEGAKKGNLIKKNNLKNKMVS